MAELASENQNLPLCETLNSIESRSGERYGAAPTLGSTTVSEKN
jgi:hypothetical protein